jgi:hypothetical protein
LRRLISGASGRHSEAPTGERNPDRHGVTEFDEDLLDLPGLEDFDLNGALLRFDHGDDVAALDPITRFHQPLYRRARLHIGAERRHAKLGHDRSLRSAECGLCGRDDFGNLRDRCIFEVAGIWNRHLFATYAADRRVKFPKGLLDNAHADFCRQAATAPALVNDHSATRLAD